MNKIRPLLFVAFAITLFSCAKEYSSENGAGANDLIVGVDCRISKIVFTDTSGVSMGGAGTGLGSIAANINSLDIVTRITLFDSLSNTIEYIKDPVYTNDSIYINADEYFIVDVNKRIIKMHGLTDPTDLLSPPFDVLYNYNAAGALVSKEYSSPGSPAIPFYRVDYIYSGANLVRMVAVDLPGGDLAMDADLTYYNFLIPRRFIYIFPDELFYPAYNQFFNFGVKNYNAVKKLTVRNYDPGNVVRDSLVSTFSNYIMSADTYVLSVQMGGDNQPSIPAAAGKLSFSYHCR
jgi:hypothetical protein